MTRAQAKDLRQGHGLPADPADEPLQQPQRKSRPFRLGTGRCSGCSDSKIP